ncbi:hypothetical protein [Moorena producens]|nr:hypothetical protein [Moorena producens]
MVRYISCFAPYKSDRTDKSDRSWPVGWSCGQTPFMNACSDIFWPF